jgi:hypothetical protein
VASIQEESAKLQAAYAGDKAMEITNREREVLRAWMELQVTSSSFIKTRSLLLLFLLVPMKSRHCFCNVRFSCHFFAPYRSVSQVFSLFV